jgi:hypothetical protein
LFRQVLRLRLRTTESNRGLLPTLGRHTIVEAEPGKQADALKLMTDDIDPHLYEVVRVMDRR